MFQYHLWTPSLFLIASSVLMLAMKYFCGLVGKLPLPSLNKVAHSSLQLHTLLRLGFQFLISLSFMKEAVLNEAYWLYVFFLSDYHFIYILLFISFHIC
jgi:hypothetical protein